MPEGTTKLDDFSKAYLDIYSLNKRIYEMETIHPEEVGTKMVKIVKITATYGGGNVFITFDDPAQVISQYERAVLEVKLVSFPEDDYATRLHISSSTYSDGEETEKDDFEFHAYMIPQNFDYNVFRLPLQKTLGDAITIGSANLCPFLIEVLNEEDSLESNIETIELYKSNTSQAYTVNDLTAIFIKLNELQARQDELEG